MRLACLDEPSSSPTRCEWRFSALQQYMSVGAVSAEIGVFSAFADYLFTEAGKALSS